MEASGFSRRSLHPVLALLCWCCCRCCCCCCCWCCRCCFCIAPRTFTYLFLAIRTHCKRILNFVLSVFLWRGGRGSTVRLVLDSLFSLYTCTPSGVSLFSLFWSFPLVCSRQLLLGTRPRCRVGSTFGKVLCLRLKRTIRSGRNSYGLKGDILKGTAPQKF